MEFCPLFEPTKWAFNRREMFTTHQHWSCRIIFRIILFIGLVSLHDGNFYTYCQPVHTSDPCDPNPCISPAASCHTTTTASGLTSYTCVCDDGSYCENTAIPQFLKGAGKPPKHPGKGPGKGPGKDHNNPKRTKKPSPTNSPRTTANPVPSPTTPGEGTGRQTDTPTKTEPVTSPNNNPQDNPEQKAPSSETSEEEWSLYGLTRNELIAIGIPMVIAVPSAILAIVKIWLVIRNRDRNPDVSCE